MLYWLQVETLVPRIVRVTSGRTGFHTKHKKAGTKMENTIENTMAMAMTAITESTNLPETLKDPFEIYALFEKNHKFDDMNGVTLQPLVVWYNMESYIDEDTGELQDAQRTYILAHINGDYAIYSGFSVTMRLKLQLLQNIFGSDLPPITATKVSKGKKQEWRVEPVREANVARGGN